jgi:hypothetical protein
MLEQAEKTNLIRGFDPQVHTKALVETLGFLRGLLISSSTSQLTAVRAEIVRIESALNPNMQLKDVDLPEGEKSCN